MDAYSSCHPYGNYPGPDWHLGSTHTIAGVVPAAAVAADVPSTLTDENVNMDAPPDPPGDSMEDETMAASGGT